MTTKLKTGFLILIPFLHEKTEPQKPLEDQIAALRKEIDELRQELTVVKTLIPGPIYGYSVTNASE